jgi:hypothetical protein
METFFYKCLSWTFWFAKQFNVVQRKFLYERLVVFHVVTMEYFLDVGSLSSLTSCSEGFFMKSCFAFHLDTMDLWSWTLILFFVLLYLMRISLSSVMLVVFFNSQVCLVKLVEEHPWNLNDSVFELV